MSRFAETDDRWRSRRRAENRTPARVREHWPGVGWPPTPAHVPTAHLDGDAWCLAWATEEEGDDGSWDDRHAIEWPFVGDDIASEADLVALGFRVVG